MQSLVHNLLLLLTIPIGSFALQAKSDEHRYRCGQRPINTIGVITSGQSARPGEFPWHAAIYRTQQLGSAYICGGFLVSDLMVITASHCVTATNGYQVVANAISVRLGMFNLLTVNRNTQEHRVEKIYRHENYTASSYRHDIALLLLQTVAEFNEYVQPICLWNTEEYGEGRDLLGYVSGWGLTEYDSLANTLKSAMIPMVSFLECLESDRNLFAEVLFDGMFCAGLRNGTNVCNGDSGGAFVVNNNGTWIARGIISFTGIKDGSLALCNPTSFAGFVNIPRYVEWIKKVANMDRFIAVEDTATNSDEQVSPSPDTAIKPSVLYERISAKKCIEYQGDRGGTPQELSYLAYVARDTPFMRVIDCFAILISERFLISTADCRSESSPGTFSGGKQSIVIETEGQAMEYGIENFHQHPQFLRSPTENNLALIELKRNISIPSSQFVCLWSETSIDLGKVFLYSAMNVTTKRSLVEPVKCFNQLLAPSIMIQSPANGFYHLVGVVVDSTCSKIRFIRLPKFVPWIESIAWGNEKYIKRN